MERFEYFCECRSETVEIASSESILKAQSTLNKMGLDGWELVSSNTSIHQQTQYIWRIWKRKLPSGA